MGFFRGPEVAQNNFNSDGIPCVIDCNPLFNPDGKCKGSCFKICPLNCKTLMLPDDRLPLIFSQSPPPPPPLPPPLSPPPPLYGVPDGHSGIQKNLIAVSMIILACVIGVALLASILCTILRIYKSRLRNSRRTRSAPIIFGTEEDFLDHDQGPEIDHPVWYINTIGLQQSVIDSIAIFKYKKDERLIEGTECSVCLNEFQEDESLRLLPKCSHAFHIHCIDTWLRSHKNCPLCRAPIVSEDFVAQVSLLMPNTGNLGPIEQPQEENSENNSQFVSNQIEEYGTSEVRNEDNDICALPTESITNDGISSVNFNLSILRNHSRVQSDLLDSRQAADAKTEPVRRSVSLDSFSALAIYNAMAIVDRSKPEGHSDSQLVPLYLKSKNVSKRGRSGSLSFPKLLKSSSSGRSLQKGSVSMKRSSSSSGKPSSSTYSGSQDSIFQL